MPLHNRRVLGVLFTFLYSGISWSRTWFWISARLCRAWVRHGWWLPSRRVRWSGPEDHATVGMVPTTRRMSCTSQVLRSHAS